MLGILYHSIFSVFLTSFLASSFQQASPRDLGSSALSRGARTHICSAQAFVEHNEPPGVDGEMHERTVLCTVPQLPHLKNRYFALRHGESTANIAGIISSLPSTGTTTHGLTDKGRLQAREAAAG